MSRDDFFNHIAKTHTQVKSWPEWKKYALGKIEKQDKSKENRGDEMSNETLLSMIERLTAAIPKDEWAKLPPDLSGYIDGYLYGARRGEKPLGEVHRTERGFEIIGFKDADSAACQLQASSLAEIDGNLSERPGTTAIWLGCVGKCMHLPREQVEALVRHLQCWLETGSFEREG